MERVRGGVTVPINVDTTDLRHVLIQVHLYDFIIYELHKYIVYSICTGCDSVSLNSRYVVGTSVNGRQREPVCCPADFYSICVKIRQYSRHTRDVLLDIGIIQQLQRICE